MPADEATADAPNKAVHIRLSPEQHQMIQEAAAKEYITPNRLFLKAIGEYIERKGYGEFPRTPLPGVGRRRKDA